MSTQDDLARYIESQADVIQQQGDGTAPRLVADALRQVAEHVSALPDEDDRIRAVEVIDFEGYELFGGAPVYPIEQLALFGRRVDPDAEVTKLVAVLTKPRSGRTGIERRWLGP